MAKSLHFFRSISILGLLYYFPKFTHESGHCITLLLLCKAELIVFEAAILHNVQEEGGGMDEEPRAEEKDVVE